MSADPELGGRPRHRASDGPALLRHAWRPFFCGAGLCAFAVMALWLPAFYGWIAGPCGFAPAAWHGHERLFGRAAERTRRRAIPVARDRLRFAPPAIANRRIMLYLTRKLGETVVINDTIEVIVVEVRKGSVKLGVTFPPEASVLRKEIVDKIRRENLEAARARAELTGRPSPEAEDPAERD